jgi:hypothetical protein
MPLYRDTNTQIVTDYPVEIGEHPVLGASLVLCDPDAPVVELDAPAVETPVSTEPTTGIAVPTDAQEEN